MFDLNEKKPAHKSKTVWVGVLSALLPMAPEVAHFVSDNPEAIGILNGIVIIGLRYLTKLPVR